MKKSPIIILHGWGLKGSVYDQLSGALKQTGYTVHAPDLPGFGKEPLISENMTLDDYINFVKKFLMAKKIKSAIFIGHSFGGRILTKLSITNPEVVEKIILTGVPIIRHFSMRQKIGAFAAVVGGSVLKSSPHVVQNTFRKILYKTIGEYDYYKADRLKKTLHNIVNEDLIGYATRIKAPTFLVWGKNDTFTPSEDVKHIQKLIPHAKSVIVPNTGHRAPYADANEFVKAIKSFL